MHTHTFQAISNFQFGCVSSYEQSLLDDLKKNKNY